MAFCGIGFKAGIKGIELLCLSKNSPTKLIVSTPANLNGRPTNLQRRRGWRIRCSSGKAVSPLDSKGSSQTGGILSFEEELGPVMKFKISDFVICDRVSIGLGGRGDELVFEAMVKNSHSPLYNKRVVLRRFSSSQAQRRGRRAIEVLKKLARRKLLYHSYSMQVHGYVTPFNTSDCDSFTLVHGYHGSYSLRHWLQLSNWLPTLEATLALDEEHVRRVGDDSVGGPAISRQLRLIRVLMRDLLIGVNYLHSHGLAHTELRLENVHISPMDRHIKGNDPSCLREFLLPILCPKSPSGNVGLQILDRNWGAGWNLLSLMLATKPYERISCLEALRHPFLCGPRWRVDPSMDIVRWGLGSTAVRITEEYIYGQHQRSRLAHFIELMEMLNPYPKPKNWLKFLPGRWRLLYSTGRHIGLTLRQPSERVLIGDAHLSVVRTTDTNTTLALTSDINFMIMTGLDWPHEKIGITGKLQVCSLLRLTSGRRLYLTEEPPGGKHTAKPLNVHSPVGQKSSSKWRRPSPLKETPSSLPIAKLTSGEIEVTMSLDDASLQKIDIAQNVMQEVRTQIPPEMFDVSRLVCGTYVDSRLLVLRGVNGSALLFTRSCR